MTRIYTSIFLMLWCTLIYAHPSLQTDTAPIDLITGFETTNYKVSASDGSVAIISNPYQNDSNNSDNVLEFTNHASSGWWTRLMILEIENKIVADDLEFLEFMVYAPVAGNIYIKLEGDASTGGIQPETYQQLAVDGGWQMLKFPLDLSNVPQGAIYNKIIMSFNINDISSTGTWLVDNIAAYGSLIKPAPRNLVSNFEGDDFIISSSNVEANIVTNPSKDDINASENVVEIKNKAVGQWWERLVVIKVENQIIIDGFEFLELNIFAPVAGNVHIKLEKEDDPSTGDAQPNAYQEISVQSGWQKIKVPLDLTNVPQGAIYHKIVLFFDINNASSTDTWLIDDIAVYGDIKEVPFPGEPEPAPRNEISNFETGNILVSASGGKAEQIINPFKDEVNNSETVLQFENFPTFGAEWWSRLLVLEIENQIQINSFEFIEFMIYAPVDGNVFLKLEKEDDQSTGDAQPQTYQQISAQDGWQKIKVPLDLTNVPQDAVYNKIVMSFNINDLEAANTWLIDDFAVYGNIENVPFPEPEPESIRGPQNLYFTEITSDGFTVNWDNHELETEGINVYLNTPGEENKFLVTLPTGTTSYRYENGKDGISIDDSKVYMPVLQSLPDPNHQAYSNGVINLNDIDGKEIEFDENFQIYLAFGQSNMEGSAPIDESLDYETNPRLKLLQSLDCDNLNKEKNKWYDAYAPTCQCYTQYSVLNGFATEMVEKLGTTQTVGIINVAIGGSDIRIFDKDIYQYFTNTNPEEWFQEKVANYGGNPYKHFVDLAKLAQKSGTIKGILLHQGEANDGNTEWTKYVAKIYNDLITDLELDATEVPLIAGQLAEHTYQNMNSIIATLPQHVPTAHVISSKGVEVSEDNVHFNRNGAEELGSRYAAKMLELLPQYPDIPEEPEPSIPTDSDDEVEGVKLFQNFPNPSEGYTTISFHLEQAREVGLKLMDLQGNIVQQFLGKKLPAGTNAITLETQHLSPGIYLYKMEVNGKSLVKKMVVN